MDKSQAKETAYDVGGKDFLDMEIAIFQKAMQEGQNVKMTWPYTGHVFYSADKPTVDDIYMAIYNQTEAEYNEEHDAWLAEQKEVRNQARAELREEVNAEPEKKEIKMYKSEAEDITDFEKSFDEQLALFKEAVKQGRNVKIRWPASDYVFYSVDEKYYSYRIDSRIPVIVEQYREVAYESTDEKIRRIYEEGRKKEVVKQELIAEREKNKKMIPEWVYRGAKLVYPQKIDRWIRYIESATTCLWNLSRASDIENVLKIMEQLAAGEPIEQVCKNIDKKKIDGLRAIGAYSPRGPELIRALGLKGEVMEWEYQDGELRSIDIIEVEDRNKKFDAENKRKQRINQATNKVQEDTNKQSWESMRKSENETSGAASLQGMQSGQPGQTTSKKAD